MSCLWTPAWDGRLFDYRPRQNRQHRGLRSEDRREIFEEAAGISRYRYRKGKRRKAESD